MNSTLGTQLAFPDGENWGLTKRELFAAMVLQGAISAAPKDDWLYGDVAMSDWAEAAVEQADELIDALNRDLA